MLILNVLALIKTDIGRCYKIAGQIFYIDGYLHDVEKVKEYVETFFILEGLRWRCQKKIKLVT